jgi:voltage-gated potassium channel
MTKRTRKDVLAWARFTLFLAREFRWAALVFGLLISLGGVCFWRIYKPNGGLLEGIYDAFSLVFFETPPDRSFPPAGPERLLWFVIPIVGMGAIADSVTRLGYFVFTSKQKLPEWHRMNAKALRDHVVVCGVGKVGYRILEDLLGLGEDVVAVEKDGTTLLVTEMMQRGVPVIVGEARSRRTLEDANVAHAKTVILATDDDLANIDAALTAREIQPGVRVVLRLFDDTLAARFGRAFDMITISTSSSAAASFVAQALDRRIYQSFQLGDRTLHVADVALPAASALCGRKVGDVQDEFGVNVVMMHAADGRTIVNPDHDVALAAGDRAVVIADIENVRRLEEAARASAATARRG